MTVRSYALGIDVGGTFTDFVLIDEDRGPVATHKILTTPADPCDAIVEGVKALASPGFELSAVKRVVHGTTLIVNSLIQRRGARVGLLCTKGFRDVLFFGREFRYDVYDPELAFPEPLVPRQLRLEVDERVGGDGEIVSRLDEGQAREQIRELRRQGVEAYAVCLLHSFTRPEHELRLRALIEEEHAGVPVSLSHEVMPQIREYERSSATVINAFVQPLAEGYLTDFQSTLQSIGCHAAVYLMTSAGGTMTIETARRFPIQLLESGPAAGVLIAAEVGSVARRREVLSFDMGGTTAKTCLVRAGRPLVNKSHEVARVKRFSRGSGLPVGVPVVDLLEVGAGGGSIAHVDSLGLLNVGPESAGAEPGPACYVRGGTLPTVTDANVVLGLINPDRFLGGAMRLDRRAAVDAIRHHVAEPMGITVEEAALAMHRVVTENMAEAARVHAVEVNVDVRSFTMVAFGGAGPIHAAGVARRLGVSHVIYPRDAGVLSAWGLLTAPLAFEFARSLTANLDDLDLDTVNALLSDLQSTGRRTLETAGATEPALSQSVEMCYVGQRYEVSTPLPAMRMTPESRRALKHAFDVAYESAYGRRLDQLPARCLTWRVLASGEKPRSWVGSSAVKDGEAGAPSPYARRRAVMGEADASDCPVFRREELQPGAEIAGPALLEEAATTIVIPPRATSTVDACANVHLHLEPAATGGRG
jgi:N-methylhydantoinase A/oxoprolinase/acetone carboxylase beta subunit